MDDAQRKEMCDFLDSVYINEVNLPWGFLRVPFCARKITARCHCVCTLGFVIIINLLSSVGGCCFLSLIR